MHQQYNGGINIRMVVVHLVYVGLPLRGQARWGGSGPSGWHGAEACMLFLFCKEQGKIASANPIISNGSRNTAAAVRV